MASGGADRIEQDLTWDDVSAPMLDPTEDSAVEDALLAYAARKAARTGAEWFAAEWQRREDNEQQDGAPADRVSEAPPFSTLRPLPTRDEGVVDAEVEANVVNEGPAGLGLRPDRPAAPVVAAPPPVAEPEPEPVPAPEPTAEAEPEPVVASAPEPIVAAPQPTPAAAPAPAPTAAAPLLPAVMAAMAPAAAPEPNAESAAAPLRHPTVPRPPVVEEPEPQTRKERRRRKRDREEAPAATTPMFTAGEWARMSPGARRLYGMEKAPPS